jgi:hypothetical protein
MKKSAATANAAGSTAASAIVTCVRAAQLIEAVKIYISCAADVIDEQARSIEAHFNQAPEEPNLGACCRLVRWAFLETNAALESRAFYTCLAHNDRRALAVICDVQRQHLRWCRASLDLTCRLLQGSSHASQVLDNERLALASIIPDLDQSIAALDPSALKLPTGGG